MFQVSVANLIIEIDLYSTRIKSFEESANKLLIEKGFNQSGDNLLWYFTQACKEALNTLLKYTQAYNEQRTDELKTKFFAQYDKVEPFFNIFNKLKPTISRDTQTFSGLKGFEEETGEEFAEIINAFSTKLETMMENIKVIKKKLSPILAQQSITGVKDREKMLNLIESYFKTQGEACQYFNELNEHQLPGLDTIKQVLADFKFQLEQYKPIQKPPSEIEQKSIEAKDVLIPTTASDKLDMEVKVTKSRSKSLLTVFKQGRKQSVSSPASPSSIAENVGSPRGKTSIFTSAKPVKEYQTSLPKRKISTSAKLIFSDELTEELKKKQEAKTSSSGLKPQ